MKKRQIMGIVNCTPDSYFEQGRFSQAEAAAAHALTLFEEGADIVDIGGESTRPGSSCVESSVELTRVLPVIRKIRQHTNKPLSIDTYKPRVAQAALEAGVNWINDITGLTHPEMQTVVRTYQAQCCVMHMYGKPHVPSPPIAGRNVVEDVLAFFKQQIEKLLALGIDSKQLVLDPGIGGGSFGKSDEECLMLLRHIKQLTTLGYPILIGLSRKSFMQKILKKSASETLSTTLALNTIALWEGATYLRVHDVWQHRDVLTLVERLL